MKLYYDTNTAKMVKYLESQGTTVSQCLEKKQTTELWMLLQSIETSSSHLLEWSDKRNTICAGSQLAEDRNQQFIYFMTLQPPTSTPCISNAAYQEGKQVKFKSYIF